MTDRALARRLAQQARADGQPLRWFEELYAQGDLDGTGQGAAVPWVDRAVHPALRDAPVPVGPLRTLVVGCGLGDDAQWLADSGKQVTAFDVSPSAVEACRRRWPGSPVTWLAADLLDPPASWLAEPFELVVEVNTVQVLPPGSAERRTALRRLGELTGGTLLLICRGRDEDEPEGEMPWPLTLTALATLEDAGLERTWFDDALDAEDPPVRRLRGTWVRR